jgi:nucleoside-diphosphate-sugar epimerase
MPLNVLVTGARGFIGAEVVRRLRAERGVDVIGLVRGRAGDDEVSCDLLDAHATEATIRAVRPTACVHAAWEIDPATYRDDERNERWVDASLLLAEALAAHSCSWLGAFGTCIESATPETSSCRYAHAKTRLRTALRASAIGDSFCWWRVFQPYGPGEPSTRFVPALLRAMEAREPFTVQAPADIRDFIHVTDIADAVVASVLRGTVGDFELGTGIGTTLAEAARVAEALLDAPTCVQLRPLSDAERGAAVALVAQIAPFRAASGWSPRIDLRSGLASLIASNSRSGEIGANAA